jgi:uncharacterized protein (TIGR03083 family)
MSLAPIDTRSAFRPLSREIVSMLGSANAEDWNRPTVAGAWLVRDVVAHLIDTALRRLSLHRDRWRLQVKPSSGQDLVGLINELNATWVQAAQRLSPSVLTALYARASADLADFMESLDLDAPAFFPVSWAGDGHSPQWLDIGREFTEVWHHGAQIREAVAAGPFGEPAWLRAVLEIAMHALPVAYRDVAGRPDVAVAIQITGRASGAWTVRHRGGRWTVERGDTDSPTATATLSDEAAWRLFFNGLAPDAAAALVRLDGETDLARPLLCARAVVV